jgi:hypothetical protein
MATTTGGSMASSSSTSNRRAGCWLAVMRCRGEHHIVPMCPVLPLIPCGRRFTCLPSLSCAGTVLRGLVAAFPHAARLDALELLLEEAGYSPAVKYSANLTHFLR